MAIKNLMAGGVDWSDGVILIAVDINDTFDEVDRLVKNGN